MSQILGRKPAQLHPYQVDIKRGWEKLIVNRGIKQDWLAMECDLDDAVEGRPETQEAAV